MDLVHYLAVAAANLPLGIDFIRRGG